MLQFEDVTAGYGGRPVLKDFSAGIGRGEFVGLIGANGTGKSTLLKCLTRIVPLNTGRILLMGQDNTALSVRERARRVAVVPQSFAIDYDFKVEDIVMMGRNPYLNFRDRESEQDLAVVARVMALTRTAEFRGRLFNALSGGEKQRVIIARALAQEPEILLLDEPTSALDVHHQIEVMEIIDGLNRQSGLTVVAVLHDLNLASRYCSRLIMMAGGRVVADGTPREVIVEENLGMLYDMDLLIRENPIFETPEVVPIRVTAPDQARRPWRIHVICGGGEAARVLAELAAQGHRLSAGVVNQGSDDWLMCRNLDIPTVEVPPFTTVTPEKQDANLKLMADAEMVLIADVPFGPGNIENLRGLGGVSGDLYLHSGCLRRDFTHGGLSDALDVIRRTKDIISIDDHDEFLRITKGAAASGDSH